MIWMPFLSLVGRWRMSRRIQPIFGRTTKTVEIALPTKTDLLWLEGALSGIVHYLTQYQNSAFGPELVEDELLPVATLSGAAQLRLRMPGLEELFDDSHDS